MFLCMFCWKAIGASFLQIWYPFWVPFGRLRDLQKKEEEVLVRCEKRASETELQAGEKIVRVSATRTQAEKGVALQQFQGDLGWSTPITRRGRTHYDHSTVA